MRSESQPKKRKNGVPMTSERPMSVYVGIGRKKIILAGCALAAITYFPLFKGLTHYVNPALEQYQSTTPISVAASDCNFHIFIGPWSRQTACDKAKDFLGKAGLSFTSLPAEASAGVNRRG